MSKQDLLESEFKEQDDTNDIKDHLNPAHRPHTVFSTLLRPSAKIIDVFRGRIREVTESYCLGFKVAYSSQMNGLLQLDLCHVI